MKKNPFVNKSLAIILASVSCLFLLASCGSVEPPNGPVDVPSPPAQESPVPETPAPRWEGSVDVDWETGAVTVEYYDGAEVKQSEQNGDLLIQVPNGARLENINIFAPEGKVEIIGVLAAQYDIETVGDDINIYLPEDTAFHVQLTTIRDIFESDFLYDVTRTKHEYIYLTDGVEMALETVIGIARVLILK